MSNSSLVNYVKITDNKTSPRNDAIRKITIHHTACVNASLEGIGNGFANPSRQASANYAIDSNGRVGMYVEEKDRAWTSSSAWNDNQAITIEVANDGGAPDWHVSDVALAKLIDLCVDICKRNGIGKLNYTGDTSGNLTRHDFFIATTCPGPYLGSKFSYIANEVNKRLGLNPTGLFRVRKSWADVKSQIGAFANLSNAKRLCDQNSGYKVFDENGNVVYPVGKSIDELAREVIRGSWGNGEERRQRLTTAGYDYNAVQQRVNELF